MDFQTILFCFALDTIRMFQKYSRTDDLRSPCFSCDGIDPSGMKWLGKGCVCDTALCGMFPKAGAILISTSDGC